MRSVMGVGLKAFARLRGRPSITSGMEFRHQYRIVCRDAQGNVKWEELRKNIVVTEGLNDVLTKYFKGAGYTATWFVLMVDNAGFTAFAAGDTAAKITLVANPPTTNGWQEFNEYDEANRPTLTLGTASAGSIDNSASVATFTINASGTLKGVGIVSSNTIGGTTGVLHSEVAFSSTRAVVDNDVIEVTATLTCASA